MASFFLCLVWPCLELALALLALGVWLRIWRDLWFPLAAWRVYMFSCFPLLSIFALLNLYVERGLRVENGTQGRKEGDI